MTWDVEATAIVEDVPAAGGLHVTGIVATRRGCGCEVRIGIRLDRNEPTAGIQPCAAHHAAAASALRTFRETPPSDEEVVGMLERLLDEEIGR